MGGCQLVGYELHTPRANVSGDGSIVPIDAQVDVTDARVNLPDARATQTLDAQLEPPKPTDASADAAALITTNDGSTSLADADSDAAADAGASDALLCSAAPQAKASGAVMLDDFEDGDSSPLASSGADGYWFVYTDHSRGTITPPDGTKPTPALEGAAGTARSMHIVGGGFTAYGAGLILFPSAQQCTFDVSLVRGVGFWLKGSTSSAKLIVSVATTQTLDSTYCGTSCNDFHNATYALTSAWTHYSMPWSDLKQSGWGTPAPFLASQMEYLQFSFPANITFSLYVDEVGFY
ncbi:MAG: hypothetical protein RLZZ450_605 [Pseudomonadota bacterium]|jgi:hypothetical protein